MYQPPWVSVDWKEEVQNIHILRKAWGVNWEQREGDRVVIGKEPSRTKVQSIVILRKPLHAYLV